MQALLLNSGEGKRMGELTQQVPKCLVELKQGETILSRQLRALLERDIREVVITTGSMEEKIKEYVEEHFSGELQVTYVHNPDYTSTNYIYSLLLAADQVKEDLLLFHGDMVFEEEVLDQLLDASHEDTVVVDPLVPLPLKDFKGRIENGLVKKVSVDLQGEDTYFLLPMYRLAKATFKRWLEQMEELRKEGKLQVYAEEGLNPLLEKGEVNIFPLYLNGETCMEIDDVQDLEKARRLLY